MKALILAGGRGTRLYDYDNPDEERRPWNDSAILDPKTGKPFNWNEPPHK